MGKYFVKATTFAMPFVSEEIESLIFGESAEEALQTFITDNGNIYAANLYESADAYFEKGEPIARYESNKVRTINKATKGMGSYSYRSINDNEFEVDGKMYKVKNPRKGKITLK